MTSQQWFTEAVGISYGSLVGVESLGVIYQYVGSTIIKNSINEINSGFTTNVYTPMKTWVDAQVKIYNNTPNMSWVSNVLTESLNLTVQAFNAWKQSTTGSLEMPTTVFASNDSEKQSVSIFE